MTPGGRHHGRVALVTGAAQGLGQAYALRLAADGARVAALDIGDVTQTVERVREAGGEAVAIECDVSVEEAVVAAATAVHEQLGPCDILINNAGISPNVEWADLDLAKWRKVLSVNLDAQFIMCRAFAGDMQASGWGRIVNISSDTLGLTIGGFAHYMASKAGVIGFTRGLATDLGKDGITVNAVCPGLTHTPFTDAQWEGTTLFADLAKTQAIKREAFPNDLDGVISFLASDDAAWITAQTIVVDGGLVRL